MADVIKQLYPQAGGGPIDGVLALDPYGLAGLIGLTGPIQVQGLGEFSLANAASELIEGQYAAFAPTQQTQQHDYLQDALRVEFQQLTSGSLPGPRSAVRGTRPGRAPGAHPVLELRQGGSARAPAPRTGRRLPAARGHDVLAVTTQNAANNKIDAYLQRSISDAVHYDPGNRAVASKVTITLHNEAPAQGLPSEVIGSYDNSGLRPGPMRHGSPSTARSGCTPPPSRRGVTG